MTKIIIAASFIGFLAAPAYCNHGSDLFDGAGVPVTLELPDAPIAVIAASVQPAGDGDTADDVEPAPFEWSEDSVDGAVSDSNPSAQEKINFMAQGFYQLCRQAKIKVKAGLSLSPFKARVDFERHFVKIPGVGVALADEGRARISLGDSIPLMSLAGNLGTSLHFGAEQDGKYLVLRPLKDQNTCHQLDRLFDVSDIEAVVFESGRMSRMRVEELWKLSVRLRTPVSIGAGYSRPGASAAITFGYDRQGEANVTLRRLSPEFLRLRLRLNRADVFALGGAVQTQIKGTEFGDETKNMLGDAVPLAGGALYSELNKALKAKLHLVHLWSKSREGLIEFILDPRDEAQMKALERLLTGDVDVLDSLGKLTERAAKAYIDKLRVSGTAARWSNRLGAEPSFVGEDKKTDSRSGARLQLPLLLDLKGTAGKSRDKITVLDEDGGALTVYSADKGSSVALLKIPVAGALLETGSRRSVMTFGGRDKNGDIPNVAVYVQQERFKRMGGRVAQALVEEAGDIMRYAGVRGRGVNDLKLPPALAFTGDPAQEVVQEGVSAFTLVLNENAVRSLGAAPTTDVLNAYVNTLGATQYRAELEWVLKNGRIGRDGHVTYDSRALARSFNVGDEAKAAISAHLDEAAIIVRELKELNVRQEGRRKGQPRSSEGQAESLRDAIAGYSSNPIGDVLAGRSHARIGYDQKMKVLVQLVDRADVSAEVYLMVDKDGRGEKDILGRYVINPDAAESESVQKLTRTLNRFRPGSKYKD